MIKELWSRKIHGSVAFCDVDIVLTAPRFGDGNWRGGQWALYRRSDGAPVWRRWHRRGCELFDLVDNTIIATTFKGSGIYAISLLNGKQQWRRLGDRFNVLFELLDGLPCDIEADGPCMIVGDSLVTRRGRILNILSGEIAARGKVQYVREVGNPDVWGAEFIGPDGSVASGYRTLCERVSAPVDVSVTERVSGFLGRLGLEKAERWRSSLQIGEEIYVLAREPSAKRRPNRILRVAATQEPCDLTHRLLVLDASMQTILQTVELGQCYLTDIAWSDERTLCVTTQTVKEWNWSYRRFLRCFERAA